MRELLFTVTRRDLDVQTFRAGGKGGQHQNRRNTGVRIVHIASGAVGESRAERSQAQNLKLAFWHLVDSGPFRLWLRIRAAEVSSGKTIEQRVDEAMEPYNLRVETVGPDGQWTEAAQSC